MSRMGSIRWAGVFNKSIAGMLLFLGVPINSMLIQNAKFPNTSLLLLASCIIEDISEMAFAAVLAIVHRSHENTRPALQY